MKPGNPLRLLVRAASVAAAAALLWSGALVAQGVTNGAVRGKVTDEAGTPVVGAVLTLVNANTGLRNTVTSSRSGLFDIENVTPGGPFTLSARAIGYRPVEQTGIRVYLGQVVDLSLKMTTAAVELSALTVSAEAANPLTSASRTGASGFVTDSFIANLPTLERNFTDFINTSPQVNGTSIAGQNDRYNNIQIDGGVNNDLFGLGGTGTPGGQENARPISLSAVKEYQILIAPFDVRQGGFTGGLVNAITKSGTNQFHGSLYFYGQSKSLSRDTVKLGNSIFGSDLGTNGLNAFHEYQYGGTFSGPIIRNKLQFFAAVDLTSRQSPFGGYLQGDSAIDVGDFGVTLPQADSVIAWSKANLHVDPGTAGPVTNSTPDHNVFIKLNAQITPRSQAWLSYNDVRASSGSLIRSYSYSGYRSGYELGNAGYGYKNTTQSLRLDYTASIGDHYNNELLLGYQRVRDNRPVGMNTPLIFVGGYGGAISIGAERYSQGNVLNQDVYEVTDNLTIGPLGRHLVTVGTHNEFYKVMNEFFPGSYGVWGFANAAALYAGTPNHYDIALPLRPGGPTANWNVAQFGLYAQDQWTVTPRLQLTYGLRVDDPTLPTKVGGDSLLATIAFNHVADDGSGAAAGSDHANTADFTTAPLWSPRVGFNYDVSGDRTLIVRGGVGIFSGRPPYVWVSNAYSNNGLTQATLWCGSAATAPTSGWLNPIGSQPTACAGGATANPPVPSIVYFDHGFRFPQTLRVALGGDKVLPWNMTGSVDLLYTYTLNQFYLNDVNLQGVQFVNTAEGGRVMYGSAASHGLTPVRVTNQFADVIRQYNASGDNSISGTVSLDKRFSNHLSFNLGYTYSKTKDRMCMTSSISHSNLQYAVLQGPLDNRPLATSCFDVPSKLVATVLFDAPLGFKAALTYQGSSGTPFTYTVNNDDNGDGLPGNDPIFVPVDSASSPGFFANGSDWKKWDAFVANQACVNSARGTLMGRNTCRNPWTSFLNARVAKSFPTMNGQSFQVSLDIFNLPNLISSSWGVNRETTPYENQGVLQRVGTQTNGQGIYKLGYGVNYVNSVVPSWNRYRLLLSGQYTF